MSRSPRLHFLDGLRGLAAAYVALYHEVMINDGVPGELSSPLAILRSWLNHGHFAVIFFIVLSGFSLMMPVARSDDRMIPGGLRGFFRRRARRILPPYYAALVLSIALIFTSNAIGPLLHLGTKPVEGALGPGPLLSHFLMIHNLKFDWAYRINAPMWTIATEWQIYFVFALLLLPIWRRFGTLVSLCVAWILGCLPFWLLPSEENFFWACPWFLGSFGLGMTAAITEFSPNMKDSWWRTRAPWSLFTGLTFGLVILVSGTWSVGKVPYLLVILIVSAFATSVINTCTGLARRSDPHFVMRFLQSPAIGALGGFSYSLYLIQHPLLRLAEKAFLNRMSLSKDNNFLFQLFIVTPVLLAISWVFADLFERPFTSGARIVPAIRERLGWAGKT